MNPKRIKALLLTSLLLGAMALVMLPSANAQLETACGTAAKPALEITSPGGGEMIKPVTGEGKFTFKVEYKASQGYSLTPVLVNVKVTPQDAGWTSISWSPQSFIVDMPDSPGGAVNDDETITVDYSFSQEAPAFAKTRLNIEVDGNSGTCVEAPDAADGQSSQLTVGFYESYQARFDKSMHKTGQNAQISIPTVIQNFGNGDIQIKFSLAENSAKGLTTALPPPTIVRSLATGGETDRENLAIDVTTPFKNGYENRRDTFIMNIDGSSRDDLDDKLDSTQLTAVIQTQGVYVPGFEAVGMLSALLGALVIARRRL